MQKSIKERTRDMKLKTELLLPLIAAIAVFAFSFSNDNLIQTLLYSALGYIIPLQGIHIVITRLRDEHLTELENVLGKEAKRISTHTQTYTGYIKKDGKDSITTLINHLAHISYSQCTHCLNCEHVKDCQNLLFRYLQVDCKNLCNSIDLVNEGHYKVTTNSKDVHDLAVEHWLASAHSGNGDYLVVHFLDPTAKKHPRNDYDETDVYFFRSVVTNLLKKQYSRKIVKWLFVGDIDNDFKYCYDYIPRVFREQQAYTLDSDSDDEKKLISSRENQLKKQFCFKHITKAAFDIIVPGGHENREIYNNYIHKEYPNIGIFGSNCVFVDSNWDNGIEHGYVFCNDEVQTLAKIYNSFLWDSIDAKDFDWNSMKEKYKDLIIINKAEDGTEA